MMNFDDIENFLDKNRLSTDAANFHGMLSGLICAGEQADDVGNWLSVIFSHRYLTEDEYEPIENDVLALFHEIRSELDNDGFGFQVLLPDESESLERRVQAIGSWCQGFLMTLIEYSEISVDELPDDSSEFVQDVQNIAEVEMDSDEEPDEMDTACLTIEEHLRIGVQLVYETLNPISESNEDNTQDI